MGGAVDFASLTRGELRQRRDRLTDLLDAWGDLVVRDQGEGRGVRLVEYTLTAPGSDLPVDVVTVYREYYRRDAAGGWLIDKYTYEYRDVRRRRRLAYHVHDIEPDKQVAHAHCGALGASDEPEDGHHLRATEVDLPEAHQEFMRIYGAGTVPDCGAFRPLRIQRQ